MYTLRWWADCVRVESIVREKFRTQEYDWSKQRSSCMAEVHGGLTGVKSKEKLLIRDHVTVSVHSVIAKFNIGRL